MDFRLVAPIAVGLVLITSISLLLSRDWRWSILTLAGQYTAMFLLVWMSWPLEMAVVKLVAGWMTGAVLGTTLVNAPTEPQGASRPINRLFRLLMAGMVLLVIFSIAPRAQIWVPGVGLEQTWAALTLIGMGLLHLGLTTRPFRVILGLLTTLSGFEILYAAVESSILVAGLLAGINLGMALVGAYILLVPAMRRVR